MGRIVRPIGYNYEHRNTGNEYHLQFYTHSSLKMQFLQTISGNVEMHTINMKKRDFNVNSYQKSVKKTFTVAIFV